MAQRLNIEIHNNGKCLANSYYHWSGYTETAYELAMQIISNEHIEDEPTLATAVKLLQDTRAGFPEQELLKAQKLLPMAFLEKAEDRNLGLLAVSKEAMEETRSWAEATVIIDIATKTIVFDALLDDSEDDDLDDNNVWKMDIDFSKISYADFSTLEDAIQNNSCYVIIDKFGNKLYPIE